MEKWKAKFLWQMALFCPLLLVIACAMAYMAWDLRAKFLADPIGMLLPEGGLIFGIGAALWASGMCVRVIVTSLRHEAKRKELRARRQDAPSVPMPPSTPEQRAQMCETLIRQLRAAPPRHRKHMADALVQSLERVCREHPHSQDADDAAALIEEVRRQAWAEVEPQTPTLEASAADPAQVWLMLQSERSGILGRMAAAGAAGMRRFTDASPTKRSLRLMPALLSALTFVDFGLILEATTRHRHGGETIILTACLAVTWLIHLRDRRATRSGWTAVLAISCWSEWFLGLAQTGLLFFLLVSVTAPGRPHAHSPLHLIALALLILWTVLQFSWWVQALQDFRPVPARLPPNMAAWSDGKSKRPR